MNNIDKFSQEISKFSEFSDLYLNYLNEVFSKISKKKLDDLEKILETIRKKGSKLFVIGNGGGAATATTMANDLGFDILNEFPINSSEKSTSEPFNKSKEDLSTTIIFSCFESFSSILLSNVKSYLNPEQPPPLTAILK